MSELTLEERTTRRTARLECGECHKWPQIRNWGNHMTAYSQHWPIVPDEASPWNEAPCPTCGGYLGRHSEACLDAATKTDRALGSGG